MIDADAYRTGMGRDMKRSVVLLTECKRRGLATASGCRGGAVGIWVDGWETKSVCFEGGGDRQPISPLPSAAAFSASGALVCWSLQNCMGSERDRPSSRVEVEVTKAANRQSCPEDSEEFILRPSGG
jgi:hypothetical protein